MKYKESELILHDDGRIYHLALHPDQVADTIILVGDPGRAPKVSMYFDRLEHTIQKREFVTHTGWIGNKRLSVLSTGIGTDNIDIVLNELDALFNIDLGTREDKPAHQPITFIRLGTAGALQENVPVDGVAVSAGGVGLDGLLHFYEAGGMQQHPLVAALRAHAAGQWDFPLAPYYASGDAALIQAFQKDNAVGYTATNSGFYGPQGRALRAPVRKADYLDMLQAFEFEGMKIINLEMETSAIYGLAALLGHRAVSLSAILANRPAGAFSRDAAAAEKSLIQYALAIITQSNFPY